jgi:hypothetical protein
MVRSLARLVSCIALGSTALLATPNIASAQQTTPPPPSIQYFTTAITSVYGSKYPITGRLDLQIFPGGHLRGYYHTTYNKLYIEVVGGQDGNYIWMDIGPSSMDLGLDAGPQGKLHVVATLDGDGSFKGQVYPEQAAVLSGGALASQFPNPQPTSTEQWIFAATLADPEPTPTPRP